MAFASSVALKAQVPVACDLCETVDNVYWYCTDCAETLCVTCQVSHARSKASRDHVIIPRADALRYKTDNTGKDGLFCETHGGGKFELHCDDCDVLVCRKCLTGDHKGHNFTDIQDLAEIRKRAFNTEVENIINYVIPEIDATLHDIRNRSEAHSKHNNELLRRLCKQRDDIITAINEWFDTLSKQIKENTDKATKTLGTDEKGLTNRRDALKLKIDEWKDVVLSSNPLIVLQYLKTVQGILNKNDSSPELHTRTANMTYIPGEINKKVLREMLGATSLSTPQLMSMSPQIIQTMDCGFKVEHMFVSSPWLAYVTNTAKNYLAVVDAKIKSVERYVTFDFDVEAFDVSFHGDIYVCDREHKCIKRHGKDRCTNLFMSTEPNTPMGIYVTGKGDIVIGTKSISANSQLLRYSDQGFLQDKIEGYFKTPRYICENRNGDICVSDSGIDQVLVFNARLQKRFHYTGQQKRFGPRGIACDAQGHIFICDCLNHRIEVIDANGKFRQMFLTEDNGVGDPWGLRIDTAGRVWIGQEGKYDPDNKQKEPKRIIIAEYKD